MESMKSDISILENSIRCLYLEPSKEAEITLRTTGNSDVTEHHNAIRNSLKNIIGNGPSDHKPKINPSDLHKILVGPLHSAGDLNDESVSSVLSYLKMLSEACQPSQSPSGNKLPGVAADTFWNEILEPIIVEIFKFMNNQVFKKCFVTLSAEPSQLNSSQAPKASSHGTGYAFHQQLGVLLKAVRTLLVFLKRAIVNFGQQGNVQLKQSIEETLQVLASLMDPLKIANNKTDFDIGLDIRCNIGVAICYSVHYLCALNQEYLQHFFRAIFCSPIETDVLSKSFSPNSEKLIMELTSSTDINKLAVAFGILNTWLDQEHDPDLYFSIATSVLNIEHGVKEAINLGSSRVLEIWTDKMAREIVPLSVRQHVASLFPRLEFFCYMYMSAHIDAVKNCCRNIISSLTKIYDSLDTANIPAVKPPSKDKNWISAILSTVLDKPAHIKWFGLSCIVKNTKKSLIVLELEPTLPEQLLTTQRSYKTAANDIYVSLMSYHFDVVGCTDEWEAIWIDPLYLPQQSHESSWAQKKTIISIILNSDKLRIKQYQGMILPILKSVMKRMNSSDKESESGETSLLAAETIKLAYELKITVDTEALKLDSVRDSDSAPGDSFRGLVPRYVLNSWLWSDNPQIRLAGFALLVETKKTSDVISLSDFESLKLFFKYNILSQNPAFRQQLFSYFKKLVTRIKDGLSVSQRKKDTTTVETYRNFLQWLWQFLTEEEGLFVGANFARRCLTLECLYELARNFPSFEVFGVTAAGNTKYFKWLTDSYENNKILALEIIISLPIEEFNSDTFCSSLFDQAVALCKSVKPTDSVTGRYLMTLLMRKSRNLKFSAYSILESMYSELENLLKQIHTTTLVQVASETPLYGCVRCIRMILANTDDYKNQDKTQQYRDYVCKLLKLSFTVDNLLFPVLGSAAPEGFLPGEKESVANPDKKVVRSVSAQMLLVCAWRTMKEICLLMSDMCCLFVIEGETNLPCLKKTALIPGAMSHLLTYNQVSGIGDHLLYLLKNLMHRGVFEQVFVGFKQLSTRLWKSSAASLNSLPEKWLKDAMDQEHLGAKSITRRSAGLPFIFQALLSAESDNESFLQQWIQRLLIFDESPEVSPIRIHSMNVLRGLFRDATFSCAMMPFVPYGLRMAFRGLKSTDWTERNSGLMLYGAVMRRTFGPKLNLMNAPTFFRKFPQMYDFLLNELDTCIQLMEKRRDEKKLLKSKANPSSLSSETSCQITCDFTFHLLLLLSSFTESGRVEDTHFKLSEFIPRIRKCGESDDMDVRKLSAKALIPFLTSPEDKLDLARSTIKSILETDRASQNHLHGQLFQFCTIIRRLPISDLADPNAVRKSLAEYFLVVLQFITKIFSRAAPTIFEILAEIILSLKTLGISSEDLSSAREIVEKGYNERFGSVSKRNTVPGLLISDAIIANSNIKYLLDAGELNVELVYNYFIDKTGKTTPFVQQFLELIHEGTFLCEKLVDIIRLKDTSIPETIVITEAVIRRYVDLCSTEFRRYPATDFELHFLSFIVKVPAVVLDQIEVDFVKQLINRLMCLCEDEDGKELTTLPIKAAAFQTLGRLIFSTKVEIAPETKTIFCGLLLQWSGSDVDDDLRFAVADVYPKIPFESMTAMSAVNQAKIWSSIIMLAQDEESSLRLIIHKKLNVDGGSTNCDRKSLETLISVFLREYLLRNPIEGLLVLVGLLIREDHEIEAKAADDDNEDRLFDKSEMNMYFEHQLLARTIQKELSECVSLDKQHIISTLDVSLLERHTLFFDDLTNFSGTNKSGESTIRQFIMHFIKSNKHQDLNDRGPNALGTPNTLAVKSFIADYLQAFLVEYQ